MCRKIAVWAVSTIRRGVGYMTGVNVSDVLLSSPTGKKKPLSPVCADVELMWAGDRAAASWMGQFRSVGPLADVVKTCTVILWGGQYGITLEQFRFLKWLLSL
jgi:hypothetical protein